MLEEKSVTCIGDILHYPYYYASRFTEDGFSKLRGSLSHSNKGDFVQQKESYKLDGSSSSS